MFVLAVATSIDALVIGFSLTFVETIILSVLVIGLVTFSLCLAGARTPRPQVQPLRQG